MAVVNFTQGWTATAGSDFSTWAKDEQLDLIIISQKLLLDYPIYVPKKFLMAEKDSRKRLVECLSGVAMLDRMADTDKDTKRVSALHAVASHFLATLRDLAVAWLEDKFNVRLIALQFNSQAPQAIQLLTSNAWEATLFASSTLSDVTAGTSHGRGPQASIGLSASLNKKFEATPALADPSKSTERKARSRSPSGHHRHHSRPSRPSARSSLRWHVPSGRFSTKTTAHSSGQGHTSKGQQVKRHKRPSPQERPSTKKPFTTKGKFSKRQDK